MPEEALLSAFELARENARLMFERTGATDPRSQAMEDLADNINSMDTSTRRLLEKVVTRLESLSNQASASSLKELTALSEVAKDAAAKFGEVYTSTGGVTQDDIEGLSQKLADTVLKASAAGSVEDLSERLKADITELTEVSREFAETVTERAETHEREMKIVTEQAVDQGERVGVVEEAVVAELSRPGRGAPGDELGAEDEEDKKSFARMIADGVGDVLGTLLTRKFMTIAGAIVGGVLAFKDELAAGWEWLKGSWTEIPAILAREFVTLSLKLGEQLGKLGDWIWERIPDWLRKGVNSIIDFVERISDFIKEKFGLGEAAEEEHRVRLRGVVKQSAQTLAENVEVYRERAEAAAPAEKRVAWGRVAAEANRASQFWRRAGDPERAQTFREAAIRAGGRAREEGAAVEVEPSAGGLRAEGEREIQARVVGTGAQGDVTLVESVGRLNQALGQIRRTLEEERKRVVTPPTLDGISVIDEVGLPVAGSGSVGGGFLF